MFVKNRDNAPGSKEISAKNVPARHAAKMG
jgi:hypothetical protein